MDAENVGRPTSHTSSISTYESAAAGTKAVCEAYNYWTGKVSDWSVQLSYGVLAANWTVFVTLDGVLSNLWSYLSVFVAVLNLFLMVAFAGVLGLMHRNRANNAEKDLVGWETAFKGATNTASPWPFTASINRWSFVFLWVRIVVPLIAGLFFFAALCAYRADEHGASHGPQNSDGSKSVPR